MRQTFVRQFPVLVALLAVTLTCAATTPANADKRGEAFFESHIRPILIDHCIKCHGPDKQKSGLRLDSRDALLRGGESGKIISGNKPDASALIKALRHDGEIQMPPKKKLADETIRHFEAWVKAGTPWPNSKSSTSPKPVVPNVDPIAHARANYWALQPVQKQALPTVKDKAWGQRPIDAFILAKLEMAGVAPSPRADRATLIRRAYFTLIGLPPTFEQVQAFVNDKDPGAWSKVIDELLASPHYGERWARHWMDIARYADTKGYIGVGREIRYPFSYTYRDYLIRALNEDRPYNRFILEQLAADKLEKRGELKDKRNLAAMGFLTVGRRFINREQEIIDDRIDVVSRGLLGLTVACARCHDHKYDPIAAADYYALYGVFASSEEPEDHQLPVISEPAPSKAYAAYQAELKKREKAIASYLLSTRGKAMAEARSRTTLYLYELVRSDGRFKPSHGSLPPEQPTKVRRRLKEQWQTWINRWGGTHHEVVSIWHWYAGLNQQKFAEESPVFTARLDGEEKRRGKLNPVVKAAFKASPPKSMKEVADRLGKLFEQTVVQFERERKKNSKLTALRDANRESVRKVLFGLKNPVYITDDVTEIPKFIQRDERNHYRNLENKVRQFRVTSAAAPPRAMVIVDKARLYNPVVFLRGDNRRRGDRVARRFPKLLSFVDSQDYNQSSGRLELANAIASEKNPLTARVFVNRVWLQHFGKAIVATPSDFGSRSDNPVHRDLLDHLAHNFMKEGWSIKRLHRTIMLSNTWQQQSRHRSEAVAVDPENSLIWRMNRKRLELEPMRDAVLAVAGRLDRTIGGKPVILTASPSPTRRTVYGFIDRQNLPSLFRTFDMPLPEASSPGRPTTTVPQQTLYMLNAAYIAEQAGHLVRRLEASGAKGIEDRITQLYRYTLSRNPSGDEIALSKAFLVGEKVPSPTGGLHRFAQALLLSNEFLFVD